MTAAIVFPSGGRFPIDPDGVERLLRDYSVKAGKSNGSQSVFKSVGAEYPFEIVANVHSDAHALLVAAAAKGAAPTDLF